MTKFQESIDKANRILYALAEKYPHGVMQAQPAQGGRVLVSVRPRFVEAVLDEVFGPECWGWTDPVDGLVSTWFEIDGVKYGPGKPQYGEGNNAKSTMTNAVKKSLSGWGYMRSIYCGLVKVPEAVESKTKKKQQPNKRDWEGFRVKPFPKLEDTPDIDIAESIGDDDEDLPYRKSEENEEAKNEPRRDGSARVEARRERPQRRGREQSEIQPEQSEQDKQPLAQRIFDHFAAGQSSAEVAKLVMSTWVADRLTEWGIDIPFSTKRRPSMEAYKEAKVAKEFRPVSLLELDADILERLISVLEAPTRRIEQ